MHQHRYLSWLLNQLKSYLNDYDLLYERQSGFRSNHSCETAVIAIIDDWISVIDKNEIVGTVLLDLSKAFDLVNHRILPEKLRHYQFSEVALQWFMSYFDQRPQQVSISNCPVQISYHLEYLKDQSLGHFFSWFISMIYPLKLRNQFLTSLLMTPLCLDLVLVSRKSQKI